MAITNGTEVEYQGRVLRVSGRTLNDMFVDEVDVIEDNGHIRTIILGQQPSDRRSATVDAAPEWLEKNSVYEKRRDAERLAHAARDTGLTPEQFSDVEFALSSPGLSRAHISIRLRDHQSDSSPSKFIHSLADQVIAWAKTNPSDRKYRTPLSAKQITYFK